MVTVMVTAVTVVVIERLAVNRWGQHVMESEENLALDMCVCVMCM